MQLLSAALLGLATNLDNLLLGIMFGLQGKRISLLKNLCIALGSGIASFACCYLASFCLSLGRLPNYLGAALLIGLGIWPLLPKRQSQKAEASSEPDTEAKPTLTWPETFALTGALALNCLAASFGAGLTGVSAVPLALLVSGCSLLAVYVGNTMGLTTKVSIKSSRLNAIACVAMVALGLMELFI